MNLAYIVLAHQHPKLVVRLIKHLISHGSYVVLHYDINGGEEEFNQIRTELKGFDENVKYAKRIKVGWGEWSITQATLNALEKLEDFLVYPDYVHLTSGADYPIRPENELKEFLAINQSMEFIQAVNITKENWVTGGLSHERYQYRHPFNWQKKKKLFDWNFKLQKLLKLKRKFPKDLIPHMGSQWWTLTGKTCQGILELSQDRQLIKFFKTVWIPDEMYIQTLVAKLVSPDHIANKCLTLYQFNHNGLPLVYTNGHFHYLTKQPFFFARKISPYANTLRNELDELNISGSHQNLIPTSERVGIVSNEYSIFYKQSGDKHKKGKRIIGHLEDQWYGDLKWNNKDYYVITGASITELKLIQKTINQLPEFVCHGALFDLDCIEFFNNESKYGNFNKNDIKLRDNSKVNFLSQIINSEADKTTCFLLPYEQSNDILDVCIWDPNAKIIHVESSPLLVYKERSILDLEIIDEQNIHLIQSEFLSVYNDYINNKDNINSSIHDSHSIHWNFCLYDVERFFGHELLNFLYDDEGNEDIIHNITYQLLFTEYAAQYMMLHETSNTLQNIILSSIHNLEKKRLYSYFKKSNKIKQYISSRLEIDNAKPKIVVIGASKNGLLTLENCLHSIENNYFSTLLPENDDILETYKILDDPTDTIPVLMIQYQQHNHMQKVLEYEDVLFILIKGDTKEAYEEMSPLYQKDDNNFFSEYLKTSFIDRIQYFEKSFLQNMKRNTIFKADINKSNEVCKLELQEFFNKNYIIT